jgi:membrane associated rhomboid family serine protease
MSASINWVLILGHVGLLRIVLLIANAVLFAWLGYIVATDPEPATDAQFLLACGVLTLLALNFFYVLLANRRSNWRDLRLIALWFDAKVSELRRRAD